MKIHLKKFKSSQISLIFALACFALAPQARAVCQQGCDLINGNTFLGDEALVNNTTGIANTALGSGALQSNTDGFVNVAIGFNALYSNTIGSFNTATGENALLSNVSGNSNTATGNHALVSNTIGGGNTANGDSALYSNTDGSANTATGLAALQSNTIGYGNTANGFEALQSNTTGNANTANGYFALFSNTTGHDNIALGFQAGFNVTTGSYNIHIGNAGFAGESRRIRIGQQGTQTATSIAGISGATVPTGVAVMVEANGHLGTTTSSARFKDEIKPMDKASEAILALKPVTFHYKHELDPNGIPQFGLVAEDVEKVNPALVVRDDQGKAYTVRYDAVNAMLLNEFLKEHRKVQELEAALAAVNERLKAQDEKIDKVNAKVEVTKPAPQVVLNNQ